MCFFISFLLFINKNKKNKKRKEKLQEHTEALSLIPSLSWKNTNKTNLITLKIFSNKDLGGLHILSKESEPPFFFM
jgi:hypothetical protein